MQPELNPDVFSDPVYLRNLLERLYRRYLQGARLPGTSEALLDAALLYRLCNPILSQGYGK